ncbi:MAG TPA: TGS domain-containing protein [Acidimicrobiales bacterium]|jgi:ribosome-interacting GTPase 1|nr:TGS domain-containing protein [Acidimicrobiales bacterium]
MPANLSPEYKSAEAEFRRCRNPEDRLRWLREMLRTVPKHKGTEHLQADIKTRIKELTEELAGPKKGGARTALPTTVRPEGAAQVALVGPPNTGKSSLHARLTGSHAAIGRYPFTTELPLPGMLPYEDVAFQLVDLPPVCRQHPVGWLAGALRSSDACLLVTDLSEPTCVDDVAEVHEVLAERKIVLTGDWPAEESDDAFALRLSTLLVASKCDLMSELDDDLAVFEELSGFRYPCVAVSAVSGEGLDRLGPFLFKRLGVVRVYTKPPGGRPNLSRPFTVRRGQTVGDVARLIHKDLAEGLRFARLWRDHFDGRQVGRDHPVEDGDVIELHVR